MLGGCEVLALADGVVRLVVGFASVAGGVPPPYGVPPPGLMPRPPLVPGMPPPFVPGVVGMVRPPNMTAIKKQAAAITTTIKAPAGPPGAPKQSTTLYVGKIAPTVEDAFVREILSKCGNVKEWKPAMDPGTKKPKVLTR